MRVLIDADPIVYQVGFAGEERWYELSWVDCGQEQAAWFQSKWRLDRFMELRNLHPDEVTISLEREAEPLPFVLATAKRKLNNIIKAVEGFLAEGEHNVDEVQLYLTDGASNFRNEIATIAPYKSNRDPNAKPIYYAEIRQYLVDHWDARIVRGAEADDAVAIEQYAQDDLYSTVICTIDKDLLMVPGLHYNYLTKEEKYVSPRTAMHTFWLQLITGDNTDNIKGVFRAGPKAAEAALASYDGDDTEAYEIVLDMYRQALEKHGEKTGYAHLTPEQAVLENARLLWMQQWPGQLWTPPGEAWDILPGYGDN